MKLEELLPNSGTIHEMGEDLTGFEFLYPKVQGFRFNHVISAQQSSDNSDSLSNALDRSLLKFIRSQSDLIVTSGKTARDENLRASSFAPMLILTKSNEPIEIPATTTESAHAVYVTQRLDTDYANPKAISIGTFQDSVTNFTQGFCSSNNFKSPVLESGLAIAKQFAQSHLLDEVDLTVTEAKTLDEAQLLARKFLSELGLGDYVAFQILRSDNTWFFRFALSAPTL